MNCFDMGIISCLKNLIIRLLAVVLMLMLFCDVISTDFPVVVICAGTALHLISQSNTAKKLSILSAKAESEDNNYTIHHQGAMTSVEWKGVSDITIFFGALFMVEALVALVMPCFI